MKNAALVSIAILLIGATPVMSQNAFDINWETVTPAELQNRIDEGFEPSQQGGEFGRTPLMLAAQWNDNPGVVKTLLDAGADVSARDDITGTTALMNAGENDNPEVVKTLLDAGADVSARDDSGGTALFYAAYANDNPEVVLLLLQAGADASAQNNDGETAWDWIQFNEALEDTQAYRKLNELRFE